MRTALFALLFYVAAPAFAATDAEIDAQINKLLEVGTFLGALKAPEPEPEPEPEPDADGDGIPDSTDECPTDPTNTCNDPVDSDGDGVPDESDECPNDPQNLCNEPPPPVTSGAFSDCLDYYAAGNSGWCQLGDSTFSDVRLSDAEANAFGVKGSGGSKAVMIAWTGAAIDRANDTMYFWGGGHNDYYGNEVYSYKYVTDEWERLTDPAVYTHYYESPGKGWCTVPDPQLSPPSAHSYDGIEYHPERGTIWLTNQGSSSNCTWTEPTALVKIELDDTKSGVWEFNPSKTETRVGLAPLTWRRLGTNYFGYPRTEWVNGKMLMGSNTQIFEVFADANDQFVLGPQVAGNASAGQGVLTAISNTLYYYMSSGYTWASDLDTGSGGLIVQGNAPAWGQMECGAVCLSWGGGEDLSLLDPVAKTWTLIDHATGPVNDSQYTGRGRVYSKWRYLPKYDVFIGVSGYNLPVYLYKHQEPTAQVDPDEGAQNYDLALNIEGSGPFH